MSDEEYFTESSDEDSGPSAATQSFMAMPVSFAERVAQWQQQKQQEEQQQASSRSTRGSSSAEEDRSPPSAATQAFFALPMSFAERMALQQQQQQEEQQQQRRSRSPPSASAAQPIAEEEEEPFPSFKHDHFAAVYPQYDQPEIGPIFGEETGVPGPGDASKSVKEDIERLRDLGFVIDYTKKGFLGEGFNGQVYRGYYAPSTHGLQDVRALQPFAVKITDFAEDEMNDDDSYQSTGMDTLERRESYETEKWVLTSVHHKNLTSIRQVINMGEQRSFQFMENPDSWYLSPDRIYIIMDYADGGAFEKWWPKHNRGLDPYIRIYLIRGLFAGLLYLHNMGIIHGDIHAGNILLYMEHGMWVPKWSDFGLGYVDANKQYRFKVPKAKLTFAERAKMDIFHFAEVMRKILGQRHLGKPETAEEKQILDELTEMAKWIIKNRPSDINQVFQQYRHLLEEPLDIQQDFF